MINIINEHLNNFKISISNDFKFRLWQKEAILEVINTYLENKYDSIILDAPTGSGKSIIALAVSYVLEKLKYSGYILTSEISLYEQYKEDFIKYKLNFGFINGVDNYKCHINDEKFSIGECRCRNLNPNLLYCRSNCEYLVTRDKAIENKITLLTYNYWLIQRNYVARKMEEADKPVPFQKRDFIFFDEAHKIDDIIQNHFSPKITRNIGDYLYEISQIINKNGFLFKLNASYNHSNLLKIIERIYDNESTSILFELLKEVESILVPFISIAEEIKTVLKDLYPFDKRKLPKEWKRGLWILDWIKDLHCKLEDYNEIITLTSVDNIIKNEANDEIKFNCLDERFMIIKHMHKQAGFKIFMSATIGTPQRYANVIALDKVKFMRIPSDFNYDKSPIFYLPKYKLSYKEKEKNLPYVLKVMDYIIEKKHKNNSGIIHTGSYEFMNYILKNSKYKNRLISYVNTQEKLQILNTFKNNKEGLILIGPSLLEGLDLKDDISRFQIFFKVPYPSLSDPLVKAKLKKSNEWYSWKTEISIFQGVGRSIRTKDDWAITYFIDGTIMNILNNRENFPDHFNNRLKNLMS